MGRNEIVQFRKIEKVFWWNNKNNLEIFKYFLFSWVANNGIVYHPLPIPRATFPSL